MNLKHILKILILKCAEQKKPLVQRLFNITEKDLSPLVYSNTLSKNMISFI
jgi:hypothetical protein